MNRRRAARSFAALTCLVSSNFVCGQPESVVDDYRSLKRDVATVASTEERLGRIAEFESQLRRNQDHPDYSTMMFWLGQSYSVLGDPATAVDLFDELRHAAPPDAEPDEMILFELGLAHLRTGDSGAADASWQEIVSTAESGSSVRDMAVHRLYDLRSDERRWEELDDLARNEVAHGDRDRKRALAYLARAQRELGDFDDAAETFETILEEFGTRKSVAERLRLRRSALHTLHRARDTLEYLEQMIEAVAVYEPDAQAYAEYHRLAFSFASLVDRYEEWGETPPMTRKLALVRAAELYETAFDGLRELPRSLVDRDIVHSCAIAGASILRRQGRSEQAIDLLSDYLAEFDDSSSDLLAIARRMRSGIVERQRRRRKGEPPSKETSLDEVAGERDGADRSASSSTPGPSTDDRVEERPDDEHDRSSSSRSASRSGAAVLPLIGAAALAFCSIFWLLWRRRGSRDV